MADDDEARPERPRRDRRDPRDSRPRDEARRATGRPARDGAAGDRARAGRDSASADRGRRSADRTDGAPARGDRPRRDGTSRHAAAPRDERRRSTPDDRGQRPAHADNGGRHVDEPIVPDDVRPADLDKSARGELRTLSKENADEVARHLVMASRLIEDDPALAHRHALAAGRRAGRVAVVRESVAITAYAVGDFALALRELRTFRRISGSDDQIALMVDSERGVGRPDRALELGRSVDRATLPVEARVGLAIAMSGARLDLGDPHAALDELERSPIDLTRVHPWSSELYRAFAAVHEDLGDAVEAARWQARADTADSMVDEVDAESSTMSVESEDLPDVPEAPSDIPSADPVPADEDADVSDED